MATKPPSAAEVTDAYISILGRPPDPGGLAHFTSAAGAQTTSGLTGIDAVIAHLAYAVATGQENVAANKAAVAEATPAATAAVTQAYEQTLGRAPDPAGLNFYVNQVIGGQADPTRVAAVLADSPEARANTERLLSTAQKAEADRIAAEAAQRASAEAETRRIAAERAAGASQANTQLRFSSVPELYKAIYGRDPDPEGLSFFQELFGPTIEPEEIDRFIGGARGQDLPTAQNALDYFNRTGDEAGMRRILDVSVGNAPLTRDVLQLYRPELVNPFQQLFPAQPQPQPQPQQSDAALRGGVFGFLPWLKSPRTGTDIQRVLASFSPESIEAKFATGYQQVFGRDIDPAGAEYWLSRFGDQDLSQAEVNRYLLGGASGEDKAASKPYEMSLTGGRPSPSDRQFFQPIYSPEYTNYAPQQRAGLPAVEPNLLGPGFNPFDYTNKAPTPLTYTGFDPTSIQYQSNLSNLAQYAQPVVTPVPTDEGIAALPTSTP